MFVNNNPKFVKNLTNKRKNKMIEQALENAYPEQLPSENNSYYSLFKWYLNTGKNRSIKNFTKESNKSERSLYDLSKKYFWKERAADFDQILQETLFKNEFEQEAKVEKEHFQNIIRMKENIINAMSILSTINPDEIIKEEEDKFLTVQKMNKLMQSYLQYLKLYEKLEEAEFENINQSENLLPKTEKLTNNLTKLSNQSNKSPIHLQQEITKRPFLLQKLQ